MLKNNINPEPPKRLILQRVLLKPTPSFTFDDACIPSVVIIDVHDNHKKVYATSSLKEFKKNDFCLTLEPNISVQGDIQLRFYHQVCLH